MAFSPTLKAVPRRRRHHLIPKFYLRRWADERNQIAVFPVDGSSPYLANVDNAGVEVDFYSVETEEGVWVDDVEALVMGPVETAAGVAMRRVDEGLWPADLDARTGLANFLALQLVRGWRFREMTQSVADALVRGVNEHLARNPQAMSRALDYAGEPALSPDELEVQMRRMRDSANFEVVEHPNASIRAMLQIASEFVEAFGNMSWRLGDAVAGSFLTSDHPIGLWHPESHEYPVGLLNAREITLPLDPTKCMLLQWNREPELRWRASEEEVRVLNALTAASASKQIYAHPSALDQGLSALIGPTPST